MQKDSIPWDSVQSLSPKEEMEQVMVTLMFWLAQRRWWISQGFLEGSHCSFRLAGQSCWLSQQGARKTFCLHLILDPEDLTSQVFWMQTLTLHLQLLSLITVGSVRKPSFKYFRGIFWSTGGWMTCLVSHSPSCFWKPPTSKVVSSLCYLIKFEKCVNSLKLYIFL